VLRACRRVLKPGGCLAFYTVYAGAAASRADIEAARRLLPLSVPWRSLSHRDLLERAGFTSVNDSDLTPEFLRISHLFIEADTRHADALRDLKPAGDFDRDLKKNLEVVPLIERGVIRRSLFTACNPY
jgi:hypothetical protein